MKRIGIALTLAVGIIALTFAAVEVSHRRKYGDFVKYGLHTDIVVGNSSLASNDTYIAQLWNVSMSPLTIEGCLQPSDVVGVPPAIVFRWDIQKWNSHKKQWNSLRGADNWVSAPFGGYWKEESCDPIKTVVKPFHKMNIAWVYKGWVTTGEPIRMAIHTSATAPPQSQEIIYTKTFVVKVNRPQQSRAR